MISPPKALESGFYSTRLGIHFRRPTVWCPKRRLPGALKKLFRCSSEPTFRHVTIWLASIPSRDHICWIVAHQTAWHLGTTMDSIVVFCPCPLNLNTTTEVYMNSLIIASDGVSVSSIVVIVYCLQLEWSHKSVQRQAYISDCENTFPVVNENKLLEMPDVKYWLSLWLIYIRSPHQVTEILSFFAPAPLMPTQNGAAVRNHISPRAFSYFLNFE